MSETPVIRHGRPRKIDKFPEEFRLQVLEFLDSNHTPDATCLKFNINLGELHAIVRHHVRKPDGAGRLTGIIPAHQQQRLRERLYEKAVRAAEDALDPIDDMVEKTRLLQNDADLRHLGVTVLHNKARGFSAVKVLEGLGDFRRAGDDVPRDGPRQPRFNLPAGAHVAVTLDITTKELPDASNGRSQKVIEAGAETVDAEV